MPQNKIDWISFSLNRELQGEGKVAQEREYLQAALYDLLGSYADTLIDLSSCEPHGGRAPYLQRLHNPVTRANLFWHPMLPHALVELGGQACDWLGANASTGDLLDLVKFRVTRIDIARDINTNLDPLQFAPMRDKARFRSHSEFVSESGTTAYVGSRSSNRYARVYRYNPPHERAHLLRVEMVVKADDAKMLAKELIQHGVDDCSAALGSAFGWCHPVWERPDMWEAVATAYRPERREGKTVF